MRQPPNRGKKMMELVARGVERLGFGLEPAQIRQFETYFHELVEWNRKVNLTSITSYEEVQAKHFLDSLTLIPVLQEVLRFPLHAPLSVVDIGAGAGLPGIPLKIALPEVQLTLIESVGKKAAFLRHLVGVLALDDVTVAQGRAEELGHKPDLRERFDLCLVRAVAALSTLVELALPFARVGGLFIAHKGAAIEDELAASANALRVLGGRLKKVEKVQLNRILSPRVLVIIEKVSLTPAAYPRRPGLPSKRPL